MTKRCSWVKMTNPLYIAYHDEEWGQPLHDDQALFEFVVHGNLSGRPVLGNGAQQTPSFPMNPFIAIKFTQSQR